jgi:hypothetical protein
LQKLDGLQKLRRHHQRLALTHDELGGKSHVSVKPSNDRRRPHKRDGPIGGPFLAIGYGYSTKYAHVHNRRLTFLAFGAGRHSCLFPYVSVLSRMLAELLVSRHIQDLHRLSSLLGNVEIFPARVGCI